MPHLLDVCVTCARLWPLHRPVVIDLLRQWRLLGPIQNHHPLPPIILQAMISLAEAWDFTLAVSYHAYGRFIDYPYACSTGASGQLMPEHAVVDELMNGMADAIDAVDAVPRYAVFSPASAGPLSGDDTSWYYAHQGTYAMIVEVGTSFEPAFSQVGHITDFPAACSDHDLGVALGVAVRRNSK